MARPLRLCQTSGVTPPAVILVRPQLAENIGKAARAMLNFGLTDLRMVAPRDGWPNRDAWPAASGADSLLEQAKLFDSLADAAADCTHIFATTVRKRGVVKPVVTPAEAARAIIGSPGRSALVFGPERSGLDSEDVALARTIVTVPVNPSFGSLNLAQAVILLAYEWARTAEIHAPSIQEIDPPAAQAELDGLVSQLETELENTGYFYPPDRTPTTKRTLRSILTKPGWSRREIQALRGVVTALTRQK